MCNVRTWIYSDLPASENNRLKRERMITRIDYYAIDFGFKREKTDVRKSSDSSIVLLGHFTTIGDKNLTK